WRGKSCSDNRQCTAENAVCFHGQCLCNPYFYYSNYRRNCGGCSRRDPHGTYMGYPHSGIDGYNTGHYHVGSVEECMDKCTKTAWRCQTFEISGSTCQTQNGKPSNTGSDWNPGTDGGWWLYMPTCDAHRCEFLQTLSNGRRTCTGARDAEEGSVCHHECHLGYVLVGSESLTCPRVASPQWDHPEPTCEEDCSWVNSHCWPGDCNGTYNIASNCVCRPGFRRRPGNASLCDPAVSPNLSTCRVSVSDANGNTKNSTYTGSVTDCHHQRDEGIRTQPTELYFFIKADLIMPLGSPPRYVARSSVGVVSGSITLVKVDLKGVDSIVHKQVLTDSPYCPDPVNSTNPAHDGRMLDCNGPITIPQINLHDGESLCADMEAFTGGFYDLQDDSTTSKGRRFFTPFSNYTKRVCFIYDMTKPAHCSQTHPPCNSEPLEVSTRLTRTPEVEVHVEGWFDPIPLGGTAKSASLVEKYRLEVHGVDVNGTTLSVQEDARTSHTLEWNAELQSRSGPYNLTATLPEEGAARLYAIILEVHDTAGNVNYARRLVLYDNTSTVELLPSAALRVSSANPRSNLRWQTSVANNVCVEWTDRFYNNEMRDNNFLQHVKTDTGREIFGDYDQQSGVLPVAGTANVNGVIKFEISWSRDGSPRSSREQVPDLFAEAACLREPLTDGETYDMWITATDIMGNNNEDRVRVSIDHTGPSLSIEGLRGRFGQDGLYVHNTTDLSSMLLLVHAADPHSGIKTLEWTLGTRDLSDDVGSGAVGVQRLDNTSACHGESYCYCPSVGACEIQRYLLTFTNLVHSNRQQGQHHREYYLTITATNHASLRSRQMMDIIIDASPPTVGVVLEGLSDDDQAEMDFTKSDVVHVRWHGFQDHESGILLYRVVLADRCLTDREMDAAHNATDVEQGNTALLKFPSEGHYFTSVVAYNGGMEPSGVACSDGITYDTSPPRLVNVTITHARTANEVACTQPDQPWFVNTNMTRVRLARTSDCLMRCSSTNATAGDVSHLPISSNHTLGDEASDHFCRTLPKMTEDSYIVLPSDYLKLTWAAVDAESEMEEYYIGMGRDRTTSSAPDLLPFTPTHGHHSYRARHSGLGHGAVFFVFLRALSKAGLHVQLTLGPVIIDVTPASVTEPLTALVEDGFLVVSWTDSTFADLEQPVGVSFDVTFRVGYDREFITPFLSVPESTLATCQKSNVTGCARYPVSVLQTHDTEQGRSFFFQLHVTNAAGHVTTVNTSAARLPAHLLPSHAVIYDVTKPESKGTGDNETSSTFGIPQDVDVILQRREMCIAWHGLYHENELYVEVGIGTAPAQDDVVTFAEVEIPVESPVCINVTAVPLYTKLFSVVRATSPGGSAAFSSDGFVVIPSDDPQNKLQVFNGKGCSSADVVGSYFRPSSAATTTLDLTSLLNVSADPGDVVFVKFTPPIHHVGFPDTVLLQTTMTGYQIVLKSSVLTAELPTPVTANTTVEVMPCLKDTTILPVPESHVAVTWELAGPWANFTKHFMVNMTDVTCMQASQKKEKYKQQYCLLDETRVAAGETGTKLRAQKVVQDHVYASAVAVCFDDSCLPAVKSAPVTFSSKERSVVFNHTEILAQSSQDIEVKVDAEIIPHLHDASTRSSPRGSCVFRWTVTRDRYGAHPISEWIIEELPECSIIRPILPWRADNPTCRKLVRPAHIIQEDPLHVIELQQTTLRQTAFEDYMHSLQLGSRLHQLLDLDLDFARSDITLSAIATDSEGRNVTWFLMTDRHVPVDGSCAGDATCVTSQSDSKGVVVFPESGSQLRDGHVYFVCARLSPRPLHHSSVDLEPSDVCGDGVVIDDASPAVGSVTIVNAQSGFLADNSHVVVTWAGFSDVETRVSYLPQDVTLNYSVALAEDRVGHVTEVWSESAIMDDTPPSVGRVLATGAREHFIPGPTLLVRWEGVEDNESGIKLLQVAVSTEGGTGDVIPFEYCHGNEAEITDTSQLVDGHSYVVLLKVVNGAGHTTLTPSEPFIFDSSPPGAGHVWNSDVNSSNHRAFSSEVGVYRVHWAGFSDPHSGLHYYRVGLGSQPRHTDVHPFVYVGLQTSFEWKSDFEQGKRYYATVEACNKAGLCSVTSSSSLTFDDSPPTAGRVTVGFDGHHSKFLGHNTSLPVQWTGFSDPQTGIQEFWWCVGTTSEGCDVIPVTQTLLSRATVRAGLTLPTATPLYVTVRARNPAGLDAVHVSDSFTVDPTPPEVVIGPNFLSPRDGSGIDSQWDRSVIRLGWQFVDPDSPLVSHTISIRSNLTGRLVTDTVAIGADTELTLTLDANHLLLDGDSHWATVTACNAAGLCTTSVSGLLLVDSTPPVAGTFLSPLAWRKDRVNGSTTTLLIAQWTRFADDESGLAAYFVTAGRRYNGAELSNGPLKVGHDNANDTQQRTLLLSEDLSPGDVVYLTIWAENTLGLHSRMVRMAFDVLQEDTNGTSGSLVSVRHSCAVAFCTKECTCAPSGQVCQATTNQCREVDADDPTLARFQITSWIGLPSGPQSFTTSAKCLEGHWKLLDPEMLSNVTRFEWSFSLDNSSAGDGIFNTQTEAVWHDAGRNTSAVHCMPGRRMLQSGRRYTLHVRVWLSSEDHVTFLSLPIVVDHSPPQVRRGKRVFESDAACSRDFDYVTSEPSLTGCWDGVFRDAQSPITKYEVWIGTSPYADNRVQKHLVGLNTSWNFPTADLETGTRYYFSIRATNAAGLMTTAVSDGVTVDVTPPVVGVAFAAHGHTNRFAQTSTTTIEASWHGFQDQQSGVTSYHVTVYDVTDNSSVMPFTDVGINTEYTLSGLALEHNHKYAVAVKARDMAGLDSKPAESRPVLVDVTAPEGIACTAYKLQDVKTLAYAKSSSFLHESYVTAFRVGSSESGKLMKVEIVASDLQPGASGYLMMDETKMPMYFKYAQMGAATAEHVFTSDGDGNKTVTVVIEADPGSVLQAKLHLCQHTAASDNESVTIQQMSQNSISVCARIRDQESGIRSMLVGIGTTAGGLQVRPLTPVGHSGHALVNVQLQHGVSVYATVHAENHAGQWSRFISLPATMDRTSPEVSDVSVTLRYKDEQGEVWADAMWIAEDKESGGQGTTNTKTQRTSRVMPGFCQWRLGHPRHGAKVWVSVSCVNGVQIPTTAESDPATILLRPPDLSQAAVISLSNNALVSPYHQSDLGLRSGNSSLEFCWRGLQDPSVTKIQYRFLHESRPLSEWSPVEVYKTSAILDRGRDALPSGSITAQVRARNERDMTSEIVSSTVLLGDHTPSLTGGL
ncbi:hypothetical protein BaRGS_00025675, partial [Batillaria attramentaria]